MTEPRKRKSDDPGLRTAGMLLAIPSLLIAGPLVGFFLGSWGDRRLGCAPWLTVIGVVLGFFAAGRETYLIIRRVQDEEERNPPR